MANLDNERRKDIITLKRVIKGWPVTIRSHEGERTVYPTEEDMRRAQRTVAHLTGDHEDRYEKAGVEGY